MTEPGAAESFAGAELVENQPLRQRLPRGGDKLTQHLEGPLPAAQVRAHNHAPGHEQIGDAYRHEESAMFALRQLQVLGGASYPAVAGYSPAHYPRCPFMSRWWSLSFSL